MHTVVVVCSGKCTLMCDCSYYDNYIHLIILLYIDRNDAVLFLLSIEKKPAHCTCVDDNGHPALVTMILTMPKLVRQ